MRKNVGLTLLELLITLSVLLILQCVAMPPLHHLLMMNRSAVIIDRIKVAINIARIEAVERHSLVRFCASVDHVTCSGEWQDGQLIQNATTGRVLRDYPRLPKGYRLIWKSAFRRDHYLDFNSQGFTQGQQGTFYCCVDRYPQYSQGLVISQSGRVRALDDVDRLREGCN